MIYIVSILLFTIIVLSFCLFIFLKRLSVYKMNLNKSDLSYKKAKKILIELIKKLDNFEDEKVKENLIATLSRIENDELDDIKTDEIVLLNFESKMEKSSFVTESEFTGIDRVKTLNEFEFYKASSGRLFNSIVNNIGITSEPISTEIFMIKKRIKDFFEETKRYENELRNNQSIKNITDKDKEINDNANKLSKYVDEITLFLESNLGELEGVIERIYQSSLHILDISEKINVLSINTSIEAARAGDKGGGFKIIAGEIRKLSVFTQKFVKEIDTTIKDAKNIFEVISVKFSENQQDLIERIHRHNSSYFELRGILSKFFESYETISKDIYSFINKLEGSVTNISPIIQLHAITIQEMENLKLVFDDFFNENIAKLKVNSNTEEYLNTAELVKEFSDIIRKRLTTSRELDAIIGAFSDVGVVENIDLNRENKDIEFF